MQRAFTILDRRAWQLQPILAPLNSAAFSSSLPRPAPSQATARALVRNSAPTVQSISTKPKQRSSPKRLKPIKPSKPLMPTQANPSSNSNPTPNAFRGRFPHPQSRRGGGGGGRGMPRKPPTQARLPDQLEGGLHDLVFINQKYNPNGTLQLKKQYLEGGKGPMQDYMKSAYGTILEPSYIEGHIGRTKLFRSVTTPFSYDKFLIVF